MATLSKHGGEVGRIEYIRSVWCVHNDGVTMRNYGAGWKLAGKVLAGKTPREAYDARKENIENLRPALAELRRFVLAEWPSINQRNKVMMVVDSLGNDLDGCWSELADMGIHTDCETLTQLGYLIRASNAEKRETAGSVVC